jgi:hypothetical protein
MLIPKNKKASKIYQSIQKIVTYEFWKWIEKLKD